MKKLNEQQKLALDRIVDSISKVEGVVGIVLFGSQARGDYDELSDYDVLILFKDKGVMWKTWDQLFQVVASLKMDLHAIPETLDELKSANSVFLEELYKYGKVLFAKIPFDVYLQPLNLDRFTLITYGMRNVSYADKMKASYFLYGKGGRGAVVKAGGTKISDGCVMVPSREADELVRALTSFGVQTRKIEIQAKQELFQTLQEIEKRADKRETKVDSTILVGANRERQI